MGERATGRLYRSNELPNDGWLNLDWTFEKAYRFLRAMDYHGLNVLPHPKVELKGEVRTIDSYYVEPFEAPHEGYDIFIPSDDRKKMLCCRVEA